MKSIPFLDDRYPVRTIYTDDSDWQGNANWKYAKTRNVAFQEHVGIPLEHVFYAYEMDSGNVLAITDNTAKALEGMDKADIPKRIGGYDAMVTALPNTMLCICTADCMPLFLHDPRRGVAAIAHCGWRGIRDGIVSNTVAVMTGQYGSDPGHIVAAFGPCICGRCYEVGNEVRDAFATRFSAGEVENIFMPKRDGKFLLDLRKSVALELQRMGVGPERIHDTGICTYERTDYPSCRRVGVHLEARRQTFSCIVLA